MTAPDVIDTTAHSDTKDVVDIARRGHDYQFTSIVFAEDGKTATVTYTCSKDNTHTKTFTVMSTHAVKTDADCDNMGTTTYTATYTAEEMTAPDVIDTTAHSATKDVVDIAALGHSMNANGYCDRCGYIEGMQYRYNEDDETYSLVKYSGSVKNLVIPAQYKGKNTVSIDQMAFAYTEIESLVLPATITEIAAQTFIGCDALTTITITSEVIRIGESAFQYCSDLETVNLPADGQLVAIEQNAFAGCSSLVSFTVPADVVKIGANAFDSCSRLATLTFAGNSVTSIGAHAFSGCRKLTSIVLPTQITKIKAGTFDGCSALTTITISVNVTEIGAGAFKGCGNLTTVNYGGSRADWEAIAIDVTDNGVLNTATINYIV